MVSMVPFAVSDLLSNSGFGVSKLGENVLNGAANGDVIGGLTAGIKGAFTNVVGDNTGDLTTNINDLVANLGIGQLSPDSP